MSGDEKQRVADAADRRLVGQRAVHGAFLMQGELTRAQLEIGRLGFVETADRLAAHEQIVGLVGFVMAVIDAEMAARHDAHAAILAIAAGKGDPGGHLLVRRQAEIGGVLMPGDEASVFPVFRPERRGEEQDVGTDEILDRVENTLVAGDRHERGEAKMGLEAQQFPEAVMAALELFQRRQRRRGLAFGKTGERAEITVPCERRQIGCRQGLGHPVPPQRGTPI